MAGAYLGMTLIVAAFWLETRGRISSRSLGYLGAMMAGQLLLGIRATVTGEWPFAVLAAVWAAIALAGILRPATRD